LEQLIYICTIRYWILGENGDRERVSISNEGVNLIKVWNYTGLKY
jgi:hypothetical protein